MASTGKKLLDQGVPVSELGWYQTFNKFKIVQRAVAALEKDPPDIIMGWMFHGCLFSHWIRKRLSQPTKLVWNIRFSQLPSPPIKTRIMIRLLKKLSTGVNEIIYNSSAGLEYYKKFGFAPKQSSTIFNGFEITQPLNLEVVQKHMRTELSLPLSSFVYGMVARWDRYKNQGAFFEVAEKFIQTEDQSARPIYFVFVGKGMTAKNPAIAQFLKKSQFKNRFHFLGYQENMQKIYSAFDVHCLYSTTEGFPNVIGESMANQIPCIATKVGDVSQIVSDFGWVIERDRGHELLAALTKAYQTPQEILLKMGLEGQKHIENNFLLSDIILKYNNTFRHHAQES